MTRNLTIAVDEELLAQYREVARRRNSSVNSMIRSHMAETVGVNDAMKREAVARMRAWARTGPKADVGGPITRGWGDHAD